MIRSQSAFQKFPSVSYKQETKRMDRKPLQERLSGNERERSEHDIFKKQEKTSFFLLRRGVCKGRYSPLTQPQGGQAQPDKTENFVPTLRRLAFCNLKDLQITDKLSRFASDRLRSAQVFFVGVKTPTPPPTNAVKLGYLFLSRSLSQKSIDFSYQ